MSLRLDQRQTGRDHWRPLSPPLNGILRSGKNEVTARQKRHRGNGYLVLQGAGVFYVLTCVKLSEDNGTMNTTYFSVFGISLIGILHNSNKNTTTTMIAE